MQKSPPARLLAAGLFLASLILLSLANRSDWHTIVVLFALAFTLFVGISIGKPREGALYFWIGTAFVARIVLVFLFPNLSDDIYRFIWDGQLTIHGVNPFLYRPTELMAQGYEGWQPAYELYARLNSQGYYSVYPPPSQLVFAISSALAMGDWHWNSIFIKVFLITAEGFTAYGLYRLLQPSGKEYRIIYYLLNPLVIVELVGNAHTEALMIATLVVAYLALMRGKSRLQFMSSAGLFAASVGFKLLPLITLPMFVRRLRFRTFMIWTIIALLTTVLLLSPLFNALTERTSQSLDLYFRNFEFNAGIYYVLRWIGFLVRGYNTIHFLGPFLAAISAILIFVYALREKDPDLHTWPTAALFAFSIYFLFSPIVHPWYLTTLVALSVLTNYRFPIVWSGMAFLSYSAYRYGSYDENLWLVAIEYIVVFAIMLYELVGPTKQRRSEIA